MTSTTNNSETVETYEQIRQRNIAANRSLLLSLKLAGPGLTPNLIPKKVVNNRNKTRENEPESAAKTREARKKSTFRGAVLEETQANGDGRRRSGRIQSLATTTQRTLKEESSEDEDKDYQARDNDGSDDEENQPVGKKRKSTWNPPREPKRARGGEPPKRKAKSLKGSRPNPKIFGHQVGTEVGDWWDSRMMCSQAGVHAPPVCGIYGTEEAGCYSVALSGGYEDDVDLGYAFTFTGAGGRALRGTPNNPKNLRTAPQSSDQQFTAVNAALKVSCERGNPVRVIRGFKNHSPFAPDEGYRYDGLYKVEKCWREPGQSGFQVCKFAFVRLPNQPRIPVKEGREAEAEQMYQDMGFVLEDLPPLPEKRQPWTQTLAKERQKAKLEGVEKIEDDPAKEDVDDESELSEPPEEEETCDVGMDVDPVDVPKEQEDARGDAIKPTPNENSQADAHDVSREEQNEKTDSNNAPLDSLNVPKQPEMDEEESVSKEPAVDKEVDEGAHKLIDASEQPVLEKTEHEHSKGDTADLSEQRCKETSQVEQETRDDGVNVDTVDDTSKEHAREEGEKQTLNARDPTGLSHEEEDKNSNNDALDSSVNVPEQPEVANGSKEKNVDEELNQT